MYSTWISLAAEQTAGFDWSPLITGIGVLGGAAVAGFFGLRTQAHQRKAAEAQADRDVSKWHRELRRTSYVDCVVTYERLRDMVEPLGRILPSIRNSPLSPEQETELNGLLATLDERYEDMFRKCQIVRLEGPADVAHTAKGLYLAAADFRQAARERARAAQEGTGRVDGSTWDSSTADMMNTLEEFIEMARGVIAVD
ncbi:hypothetical protein [Streptomyces sp. NPDC094032]|uniref:hypothetical protein n=1 Tax=Streptomyces sp. NPDC094032 TaxID=3155308 RepID=UPI003317DBA5